MIESLRFKNMYIVWCVYNLYILKDGFEKNYWLLMKNNHENIEPLTPMSDQERMSLYSVNAI